VLDVWQLRGVKKNTGMNSIWFRSFLTAAAFMVAAGVLVPGPTDRAEAAPASASPAASAEATPKRWSYVWQRWDGTNLLIADDLPRPWASGDEELP
jgi:hypothetical protein